MKKDNANLVVNNVKHVLQLTQQYVYHVMLVKF